MVVIENGDGTKHYSVIKQIAKSLNSNFYLCTDNEKEYFLQIAATAGQNARLDFSAVILRELKEISDIYEKKYQAKFPGQQLNYDLLFPTVIDSFDCEEQGNRTVNILAVNGDISIERMVPLSNIRTKDGKVVDLATSVWIIGRLLKLLVLAHDQNISIMLTSDNVIIEPELHRLTVLDWTNVKKLQEEVPDELRSKNITAVAKIALNIIGDDVNFCSTVLYDKNIYVDFLKSLVEKPRGDTQKVYDEFEAAHGELFEDRIFYPFTATKI